MEFICHEARTVARCSVHTAREHNIPCLVIHVPLIRVQCECPPVLAVEGALYPLHTRILCINVNSHLLRGERPYCTPVAFLAERIILVGHDARRIGDL